MTRLLALREARVFLRRRDVAERLAAEESASGVPVVAAGSVREAVVGADVVVTATGLTTDAPLVRKAWVSPGAFVCGLGSYQEIDGELGEAAEKIVVDSWAQCSRRGQLAPLVRAGRLDRDRVYAELPAMVAGQVPGRSSEREIIVGAFLGLGVVDIAVAAEVYRTARREAIGRDVSL